MAEYLAPGVYVEEVDSGLKPMEGVSTSTAGFVGMTQRGKLRGTPEFVGSYMEFQRKFGGYLPKDQYGERRYLPMAVEQFFANGGSRCFVVRLLDEAGAATAQAAAGGVTFRASSPGAWGNQVVLSCRPSPMNPKLCTLQAACGEQAEVYSDVSLNPEDDGYLVRLLEKSLLVHADYTPNEGEDLYTLLGGTGGADAQLVLTGGADCADGKKPFEAVDAAVLAGDDQGPGKRTGLHALEDISEVSIVVAPGVTDPAETAAVVTHCETAGNRVCILDMPSGMNSVTDLQAHRAGVDSSFAAMYHPWIQVFDPLERRAAYIPPSGAIAGIYARTDNTRGVHKAPANEVVRNCTGLETLFGKPEQDMLNPVGVNLIRSIPGQGIRVWGARTCSSDSSWRYINVRRLFIFLEESIRRNTGWAVFEPNDQLLWTKVYNSISSFLRTQWREGALSGASESEAFFVNVGLGSSMTQDDVLNGRMICTIGVAPSRPAEFVIFRISQIMENNS